MTLEEMKYISDELQKLRDAWREDLIYLRNHLDEKILTQSENAKEQSEKISDNERRLTNLENISWKVTAILTSGVVLAQIVINVAIEYAKR